MRQVLLALTTACVLAVYLTEAKPTLYKLNENDKLEPVLIPVSSTVIPMPVYKVGTSIAVSGGKKPSKNADHFKLITVDKKYTQIRGEDAAAINIKQISKDEFETQ